MGKQTGRCVIVAAGDLSVTEIKVSQDDLLIAVDGGMEYCEREKEAGSCCPRRA